MAPSRTSTHRPSAILLPRGWSSASSTLSDARVSLDHALVSLWGDDPTQTIAHLEAAARQALDASHKLRSVAATIRAIGLDEVDGQLPDWEEGGDDEVEGEADVNAAEAVGGAEKPSGA